MNKLARSDHFKARGTEMHKGKFDYSLVDYVDAKTKVTIICPTHGVFIQTPDKHLAAKSKGCQQCWREIKDKLNREQDHSHLRRPFITEKELRERCYQKYGDKFIYDFAGYDQITGNKIKITCPKHGDFYQTMACHLSKKVKDGCPKCGAISKLTSKTVNYEETIQDCHSKHNFIYDYPEYNKDTYKNRRSKITIVCSKHGPFIKKAQKHLSGQGCFHCRVEEMIDENILVGGYSENLFKEKPELKTEKATLYYLEVNNGECYKIGITRTSTAQKLAGLKSKSKKDIKILKEYHSDLYSCFVKEQEIIKLNNKNRIYTSWSTEVFDIDIWDSIKHYFV